ncbi:hypothetical protein [Microseira sp. BLCC-F43]|jgi:hypothetical protein|uniref:hypothetical protein n=1 Tax=Microseira sp. BLCC-F43 TaxID=3153602 RepID=UPI0035B879C9
MAKIKIADLQHTQFEFAELSQLEMEAILGGGWFRKLTGIRTPSFLRKLDDWVHDNVDGGWIRVVGTVIDVVGGGGGGGIIQNMLE